MTIIFYSCFVHINVRASTFPPDMTTAATLSTINMENATAFISFASSLINIATLLVNVSILFVMVTFFRNSLGTTPCNSLPNAKNMVEEEEDDDDASSLEETNSDDEDENEDENSSISSSNATSDNEEIKNDFKDLPSLTKTIYNTRSRKAA